MGCTNFANIVGRSGIATSVKPSRSAYLHTPLSAPVTTCNRTHGVGHSRSCHRRRRHTLPERSLSRERKLDMRVALACVAHLCSGAYSGAGAPVKLCARRHPYAFASSALLTALLFAANVSGQSSGPLVGRWEITSEVTQPGQSATRSKTYECMPDSPRKTWEAVIRDLAGLGCRVGAITASDKSFRFSQRCDETVFTGEMTIVSESQYVVTLAPSVRRSPLPSLKRDAKRIASRCE